MTDFILLIISIGSLGGIMYTISKKVPFLLAIPENIINESFVTKPSKIKLLFELVKDYIREKKYEWPLLTASEWLLRKIRIIFLKNEQRCFRLLRIVQGRRQFLKVPSAQREYLKAQQEKDDKKNNGALKQFTE